MRDHEVPRAPRVSRDARRGFQFDAVPLAVIERERVALVAIAACQGQAGGGIETAAQQADGLAGRASFRQLQRQQEADQRERTRPAKAVCMENRSEIQPVSGMKIRPAIPQAKPIINAETVPAWVGASSWPITTFTGMVNSRISPPRIRPAMESAAGGENEQHQKRHRADHGKHDHAASAETIRKSPARNAAQCSGPQIQREIQTGTARSE